jgi:agmatinase
MWSELGVGVGNEPRFKDVGDLPIGVNYADIEGEIAKILNRNAHTLTLGGDHSITYPVIRAHATKYPKLTILQFDAHPDLYDELDGNRHSHACPFARIMENGLATRLIQVGIRTLNPHQQAQAERFGVEIHQMKDWTGIPDLKIDTPLYISLDLDALDPAHAPGVSHHEAGGLTTRDIINVLHNLNAPIVGADIVELNPTRDLVGMTAMVAAKFVKEIVSFMVG